MAFKTAKHPVNGMEMLVGQHKVIFENGVVCSIGEYESTLDMSLDDLNAQMRKWEVVGEHYQFDFRYAVSTGVIRRKAIYTPQVKTVPIEEPVRMEVNQPGQADESIREPILDAFESGGSSPLGNYVLEKDVPHGFSLQSVIFYVMCCVGIMSAVMSAYHTAVTMMNFGRPLAIGVITGTVMVLFSATAFTAARWFFKEKGAVAIFSVLFLTLGSIIVLYSMLSTLTVNYSAWSRTDTQQKQETASNSAELNSFNMRVELKKEEIKELSETENRLSSETEYWRTRSWKHYDALTEQLKEVREKLKTCRDELSSLLSTTSQVVSKASEEKEDVFTFLAGFINIKPSLMRLFMQAVPAMFFDVIAPFSLSCAVYLDEKRRKRQ